MDPQIFPNNFQYRKRGSLVIDGRWGECEMCAAMVGESMACGWMSDVDRRLCAEKKF